MQANEKPYLLAGQLHNAVSDVFAAELLMRTSSLALLEQPDLSLALAPTLPASQSLARSHARRWIGEDVINLQQVLTDIDGYANAFFALSGTLREIAAKIDSGNDAARHQFCDGLSLLRRQIDGRRSGAAAARWNVKMFQRQVEDDEARYASEARLVAQKCEVPELQQRLTELGDRLRKDNEEIAWGATKAIPGAMVIGIGVGAAWLNVSAGKAIVNYGISMTKKASAAADKAMADSDNAVAEFRSVVEKLAGDQQQVGVFHTIRSQVKTMATTTVRSIKSLDAVEKAWVEADDNVELLDARLRGGSPHVSGSLQATLERANSFWKGAREDIAKCKKALAELTPGSAVAS